MDEQQHRRVLGHAGSARAARSARGCGSRPVPATQSPSRDRRRRRSRARVTPASRSAQPIAGAGRVPVVVAEHGERPRGASSAQLARPRRRRRRGPRRSASSPGSRRAGRRRRAARARARVDRPRATRAGVDVPSAGVEVATSAPTRSPSRPPASAGSASCLAAHDEAARLLPRRPVAPTRRRPRPRRRRGDARSVRLRRSRLLVGPGTARGRRRRGPRRCRRTRRRSSPKPEPISSSSAVSNAGPKPCRPSPSSRPELGGEVVALEQADVVDPAGERLGRLDLDRAVALEARGRRDQLADDHVLLQAGEAVDLALERRVGEHLGGLLEGGRRQERVRRQRRLGDAEDDLLGLAPARRPASITASLICA